MLDMIKQAKQPTVVVTLEKVSADRIWTEFRGYSKHRDIAKTMFDAIQGALKKHKNAPDDALIPVTVSLTQTQAREILKAFKPYVGFPHDYKVYKAVNDALQADL